MSPTTARALFATLALATLAGCPTRMPEPDAGDAEVADVPIDPRVPNVGAGSNQPSCSPEAVIRLNGEGGVAFRAGNEYRVRVDTRGRRNELHPSCVDRDSSEVVMRYTAPPEGPGGRRVLALQISTLAVSTQYDTVLSVRNDCGQQYRDYNCNNDALLDDGRETRRSMIYFMDPEAEQHVYIVLDGFDGSAGVAEVVVREIWELGVLGAPCLPVPPSRSMEPNIGLGGFRCPHEGLQCAPGAAPDGTDICLPLLPLGHPCDPEERRNVCEPYHLRGVLCAQNPMSRTEAVCALPGTAPGAQCRRTEPRCDGRLACSPGSGFNDRDICVPLRSVNSTCDPVPRGYSNQCEPGLRCCGDSPDAGATFFCRPMGSTPCHAFMQ